MNSKCTECIERMDKQHDMFGGVCGMNRNEGVDACIREARKSEQQSGWIPVTERLPENDEMVLVSCQTTKGVKNVNRAYYMNGSWHGSGSMSGVKAWQPLPDPYEPQESEDKA